MKIALVMLDRNFGGMQKAFVNYAIELTNRGIEVLCVCRNGSVSEDLLRKNGVPSIFTIRNRFGFYDPFSVHSMGIGMDVFFANETHAYALTFGARPTYFSGKLKRGRSGLRVAASLPNKADYRYYRNADILIPSTGRLANPNYHKNLQNTVFSEVVPRFSRVKPVNKVQLKQIKNLIAAGRFVRKKGFDYLLRAIRKVKVEHPEIILKIAGNGPEEFNLKTLCSELNLDSNVEFLGFRTDVPRLIAESDMLIVPSIIEPFGNILLEGMAVGTPIVTTRNDGALENLDSTTAKFADKASATSLAAAIMDAMENPESTHVRAENALKKFKKHYTPDVVIPQFLSVLEKIP